MKTAPGARTSDNDDQERGLALRLLRRILVVVIPVLFAVIVISVALQLVGIPVFKTAKSVMFATNSTNSSSNQQSLQEELASTEKSIHAKQDEIDQLKQQIETDSTTIGSLQQHLEAAESQTKSPTSTIPTAAAEKEGQILVQMDPVDAAKILLAMDQSRAAGVIHAMQATDVGPILAEMPPAKAQSLMQEAASLTSSQ